VLVVSFEKTTLLAFSCSKRRSTGMN